MINEGSGITKCNQQKLFGTEIAQGNNLQESMGPGWGHSVDHGKGRGRGLCVSEKRCGLDQEWAVAHSR